MQVLFVPGADIRLGNSLEGTVTLHRLKAALRQWQADEAQYILVTGGRRSPSRQTISTRSLMRRWLMAEGVPVQQIVLGALALDSYGAVRDSFEPLSRLCLERRKVYSAVRFTLVSDPLHCRRLAQYFRQFGHEVEQLEVRRWGSVPAFYAEQCKYLIALLDPFGLSSVLATTYRSLCRRCGY
ncbi:MAG: YdcF family protein [Patescibacteria group bacterium]|jgi:uncharacterized SAM-binding protein YcdF (DUF218 family)